MSLSAMYSEMPIRSKLHLLVATAALGLLLLALGGVWQLSTQNQHGSQALQRQATVMRAVVAMENANVLFKTQSQEFKNVLLRGYSKSEFDKYLKQFDDAGAQLRRELEKSQVEMSALGVDVSAIPPLLQELSALNQDLHGALSQFDMADHLSGQKVDKAVPGRFRKPTDTINQLVAQMEDLANSSMKQALGALEDDYSHARTMFVLSGALIVLALFLVSGLITRELLSLLGGEPRHAQEASRRIAAGDLSTRIEVASGDQSSMMAAMLDMQNQLSKVVCDIRDLVSKADHGDFSARIVTTDKRGFGLEISEALNHLVRTTEEGLNDITKVSKALSMGDLSVTVDHRYEGQFAATIDATNETVRVLNEVIGDVRRVVDAAAQGDFSPRIDASSRQGYAKVLAQLLNDLNSTAHAALSDIADVAHALADGDLSRQIEHRYPGLFGVTASGLNATMVALRQMVQAIQQASGAINVAAGEIAAGNSDLSARTEEQASSLEQTAASMEELNGTVKQNADNAEQANEQAQHSATIASKGGESVKRVVSTMSDIQASSRKMSDIVGLIDGIAFQTNILALNAAVEAARAGEQGRGFAVVATEVRALSQRSAGAAKEIKTLIDESLTKVDGGSHLVEDAGATMDEVVHSFESVVSLVNNITEASREQAMGIEQIAKAVAQMDEVTQQNAALVEQAAAAAESLQEQARQLVQLVGRFKGVNSSAHSPLLLN